MYELSKKEKDKKHNTSKIKEVKFRVRIEQHDYETKLRHAEEFLFKGNKVKVTLQFRGREMEHRELGVEVVERAVADLAHVGTADSEPRLAGRLVNLVMSPLPQAKRRLKFNEPDIVDRPDTPDESDVEDDDEQD
jgi:translation initiation factor IF-3